MKRPSQSLLLLLLPSLGLVAGGCQRSMNGSMASGPFAPAGTAAPAGGSQLFPVGPITGATRVPPPPTGSATTNNSYISPPSAASFGAPGSLPTSSLSANPSNHATATGVPASFASNPAPTASDAFRNSLGGMPVIDLTAQTSAPSNPSAVPGQAAPSGFAPNQQSAPYGQSAVGASPVGYGTVASASPVGSGVYQAPNAIETSVRASQPSELLRPIDTPFAAVPVPRYRGMEPTPTGSFSASPSIQPAGGFTSDAWQSVPSQTVPATSYSSGATVGVTRNGPSTDPVTPNSNVPAAQTASPSLPWRSPTTAR